MNDSQVVAITVTKRYADLGKPPGVHVWVQEMADDWTGAPS